MHPQNPQSLSTAAPRLSFAGWSLGLVFLVLVYVFTSCAEWGDTQVYVGSVLDASRTGRIAPLFEFGHLLWRPLGFLIYNLLPVKFWGSPQATVSLIFLAVNLFSGFVCTLLFFDMARLVSRSIRIALVTAGALFCANAFLSWGQTGVSYITGLALLTAASWVLLRAVYANNLSLLTVPAAGVLLALSALIWFPYITAAPGVVAILLFVNTSRKEFRARLGWVVLLTLVTVMTLALVIGYTIRMQGFTSLSQVAAWIQDASHGTRPTIAVPRLLIGFPRSFLNMGRDGMMFKRYLLHDPYAKVSLFELVGVSLLRLAVFYLFLGYVILRVMADPEGRPFLWVCLFATVPLLIFALFLFESSDTERYLPLYPFLLMLIAFVLGRTGNRRLFGVLAGLMILASLSNLWERSFIKTGMTEKPVVAALMELKSQVNDKSIVWVLNTADPEVAFAMSRPFHPLNQPERFPVRQLILTRASQTASWRQDFARLSMEAFNQGGSVWVSNHLLAPLPQEDGNWTEGDIPGLHWTDLPQFFKNLGLSESGGPPDGFTRLLPSTATLDALSAYSKTQS